MRHGEVGRTGESQTQRARRGNQACAASAAAALCCFSNFLRTS